MRVSSGMPGRLSPAVQCMYCLFNVREAWQYSSTEGCYMEDPYRATMPYPPVIGKGTKFAQTAVAGQYIQHLCPHAVSRVRGDHLDPEIQKLEEQAKVVVADVSAAKAPKMQTLGGDVEAVTVTLAMTTSRPDTTISPAGDTASRAPDLVPAAPAVLPNSLMTSTQLPGLVAQPGQTLPSVPPLLPLAPVAVTVPPGSATIAPVATAPPTIETPIVTVRPVALVPSTPTSADSATAGHGHPAARYKEGGQEENARIAEAAETHFKHHAEWPYILGGLFALILVCAGAHALRVYRNNSANYYCFDPEESEDDF